MIDEKEFTKIIAQGILRQPAVLPWIDIGARIAGGIMAIMAVELRAGVDENEAAGRCAKRQADLTAACMTGNQEAVVKVWLESRGCRDDVLDIWTVDEIKEITAMMSASIKNRGDD